MQRLMVVEAELCAQSSAPNLFPASARCYTQLRVVVLEKTPEVYLIALFFRGFWLEVCLVEGRCRARYVHGKREVAKLRVGRA